MLSVLHSRYLGRDTMLLPEKKMLHDEQNSGCMEDYITLKLVNNL